MNTRKFNPANLPIDLNTIGAVIGILAVIAAVVGGVVGSGALNDQSGSSRGASMQVITPPSNTNPAPSKPEAETEPSAEAESEQSEDYFSPGMKERLDYLTELELAVSESIRRQDELLRQSQGLTDQAGEYTRQAEEMIRQRAEAGMYN